MAQKFLSNIELEAGLVDVNGNTGTAGQILSSTGTGVDWISQSEISSDSAEVIEVPVKNLQGSALTKGDPVYISGSVGSSGRLEVQLADAGNTAKMPAVGLLKQDLAVNGEGYVVVTGKLRNLVTSPIDGATPSEGDVVYVKSGGSTGAALTTTKPTGTNLIQNMGKVGRVSTSSDGTFVVSSILRANDVPTPLYVDHSNQRLGIGETSPGTILDIKGSSPYITLNTTGSYTSWGIKAEKSGSSIGRLEWVTNSYQTFGAGVILTSNSSYMQIPDSTSYDFHLNLVGNRVMQIDSGTRTVGIGTTVGLNVAPTYGVQPNLVLGSGTSTTGGVLSLYNYDTTIEAGDTLGIIQFVGKDDTTTSAGYTAATIRTYTHAAAGAGNSGGGELAFSTASSAAGSSPAERMRIDQTGNVGIGTSSPDANLHVNSGTVNTVAIFQSSDINANIKLVDSNATSIIKNNSGKITFTADSDSQQADSFISFEIDGASEKMRINSSGNVGIGTTSPSEKLEVSGKILATGGQIRAGSYLESFPSFSFANDTDTGMFSDTADQLEFVTGGSSRVVIKSSGYVGIGTTGGANAKLEVSSTGANGILISQDTGTTSNSGRLFFQTDTSSEGVALMNSNGVFQIRTGAAANVTSGTVRVSMLNNGNFGINVTSPSAKLHVGGTARFNEYVIAGNGSGGVALTHNDNYGNANVTFNHLLGTPEQNGQSARIKVNTDNTTDEATMEFELSSSPVTSGTAIDLPVGLKLAHDYAEIPYRLTHAGDTDTYLQFDANRIRLVAGGSTFLDSDSPYIDGSGTADRVPKWSDSDTLTDSIIREQNSGIGIGGGVQSGFILDVNGQSVMRGNVFTSGDIARFGTGAMVIRNNVSNEPIVFRTESTSERMRITSSGEVQSLNGSNMVSVRKADRRTTTGTHSLVGGASLYYANANATYNTASLTPGDIVTIYCESGTVTVNTGGTVSLFKDGEASAVSSAVTIGADTIATVTCVSATKAIISGSDLT